MSRPLLPTCLSLAALLALAACTAHAPPAAAPSQPHLAPPVLPATASLALPAAASIALPATASLALDLAALWSPLGPRRLLAARGLPRKARITIAGPDLAPVTDVTQDLATSGTLVTLGDVPVGDRMLVKVVGLDATGQPIPGLVPRAIGKIGPGLTTMPVTPMTTAAGLVVEALAAKDAAAGTHVIERLDYAALDLALPRYARELRAPAPGLLDAVAIAADIHAANGAVPVTRAAFLQQAGRLVLAPAAWPPGATATVTLDDPASAATPFEGKPVLLGPIAPGTWTMTVVPDQPGLAPISTTVTVAAGADTRAAIGFGAPTPLDRLPAPLGAAGAGVVTLADGQQALALVGGTTLAARQAEPLGALLSGAAVRWPVSALPPPLTLPETVTAPAAAVAGGKLYWFGGLGLAAPLATAWMYDPAGNGSVVARTGLPGGTALYAASAAAIGGKIWLTGGQLADGTPSSGTLAYDVATDAWSAAAGPAITPHRTCMASAVVGETWYLFGGFGDAGLAAAQPAGPIQPVARVSAWKPGAEDGFRSLTPLPTPRAAAAAVVANGRVWVIGGVTRDGALTGAVEVYDPATDSWSLRPPLQRPRAYAAAGLVAGKIVVVGGLLGSDALSQLAVDDVEAYTP